MTNDDLPPLYQVADTSAKRLQSRHLAFQRTELVSLVLAAVMLEITWVTRDLNVPGLTGAALLMLALGTRVVSRALGYEACWHQRRSAAETIKGIAWQYAVGGGQYPVAADEDGLRTQLNEAVIALAETGPPGRGASESQVTVPMREIRQSALERRQQCYLQRRLQEQQSWYRAKALGYRDSGRRWSMTVMVLEGLAVTTAALRGFGVFDFDWAGVLGAAAAAAVAWHQARQHTFLSSTYSATDQSLGYLVDRLKTERVTVAAWPAVVAQAEEILAREHSLWLHRQVRTVPQPPLGSRTPPVTPPPSDS